MSVAVLVYWAADIIFLESSTKSIQNQTKLIANDIGNSLIGISDDIRVLAKTPPIQGIIRSSENYGNDKEAQSNTLLWVDRLETIFTSMLAANKDYTQIRYIGKANNGKELVRVNQSPSGIQVVHQSALQNKGSSVYVKQGLGLAEGSLIFSDINYNVENGKVESPQVVTMRVLTPVYTPKHKIFGLIIVNVNMLHYLRDILRRSANEYSVILYDQYGNYFIYDPAEQLLTYFEKDHDIPGGLFGNNKIDNTKKILPTLLNDKSRLTIRQKVYSNVDNDDKVFTVLISVPKAVIMQQDDSFIKNILFWIVGICIMAAFIVFFYTKKTMSKLTDMADNIASYDNKHEKFLSLPVELNDEVGLLARAFEKRTRLLNKLAMFDSLTGMPNRKSFVDMLDKQIIKSLHKKSKFAVLYLDLNHFKDVNDTYGHHYGDDLLIKFSSALKECMRECDVHARLGGDEFGVVVNNIKNVEELQSIVKRYEEALNRVYMIKGVNLDIKIAGGYAVYPNDTLIAEELLQMSDEAMYRSKKEGKGLFQSVCSIDLEKKKNEKN
jgi:diguanylate cyclase (GGDEF)-like protein